MYNKPQNTMSPICKHKFTPYQRRKFTKSPDDQGQIVKQCVNCGKVTYADKDTIDIVQAVINKKES